MTEYAPRAVVESPFLISQKMVFHGQTLGLRDRAGRRILHFIKRTRKAVGIVDCFWRATSSTWQPLLTQGAETTHTAFGFVNFFRTSRRASVNEFSSSAPPFEPRPSRFLLGNRIGVTFPAVSASDEKSIYVMRRPHPPGSLS